ncbi:hypothetical protein COV13_03795 [Candidatus Woesearchaeota archaeon CG10_big_fil_rev_8_21_14_0_10_32_9]|nr:MAG: hypothetical protein COV13_03795 [Candidatus Woesearchaeota archaeon CG10_big_fil_rev_8_21_14_0_10_32_9]
MIDSKEIVNNWDAYAKYISSYFGEGTEAISNFLKKIVEGKNLNLFGGFENYGLNSVEFDASMYSLKNNNSRNKIQGVYNSNIHLPFKNNSFDSATMVSGWQYIENTKKFMKELERVLTPGAEFHVINGKNLSFEPFQKRSEDPDYILKELEDMSYDCISREIPSKLDSLIFHDILSQVQQQHVITCISVALPKQNKYGFRRSKIENRLEKELEHIEYIQK